MEIISRKEAKAMGARVYFTGAPCKNGHISKRFVANKWCAECASARQSGSARHAFNSQKYAARKRGINFEFSFEEWEGWWLDKLGAGWRSLRGIKRGKFTMSRRDDAGPYAPWNVDCVPTEQNCSDRAVNGVARGGSTAGMGNPAAKLTNEQAIAIFHSGENKTALSRLYGVSRPVIAAIKAGRTWAHVTEGVC